MTTQPVTAAPGSPALLRRGRILEGITLGWNVAGIVVLAVAAISARSVALAGFGLDSLIEIGASTVVLWEERRVGRDGDRAGRDSTGAYQDARVETAGRAEDALQVGRGGLAGHGARALTDSDDDALTVRDKCTCPPPSTHAPAPTAASTSR